MIRALTDKYQRMPVAELVKPIGGLCNVYIDHWWIVTPGDEVLFYGGLYSPQCNTNKSIAEHLMPEGCTVKLIPLAFVRARISDY